MTSNTPNPHQHILERRLPAWAREATPEHWQRLHEGIMPSQGLPDSEAAWFANAAPHLREAVKASQARLMRSQRTLARHLRGLKNINEFAEPLLAERLRKQHGLSTPLRSTSLIVVKRFYTFQVYTIHHEHRSLLQAALQNFAETVTFDRDSALALEGDWQVNEGLVTGKTTLGDSETEVDIELPSEQIRIKPLALSPAAFATTCHELDIGQRYQAHLDALFTLPLVRPAAVRVHKASLRLAADLARVRNQLDGKGRDAVQALLDDGKALACSQLSLFGITLHEAILIDTGTAGVLLYLPAQADSLRAFDDLDALHRQLRADLQQAAFRQGFMDYVPREQQGTFASRLRQSAYADLHACAVPIDGNLYDFLHADHVARLRHEALQLAVPSAQADEQARKARKALWDKAGLDMLMIAGMFVPALGTIMTAVMAYQLLDEAYEGYEAWQVGDREEAFGHFKSVALNLAVIGGLHLAGKAIRHLAGSPLLDGLDPVTLDDGSQRLWRPDLTDYRSAVALPEELEANAQGQFLHQGRHFIRMDGHLYEQRLDTRQAQWRIVHPDDSAAFQPPLEHNGAGAWRGSHEQPRDWSLATLVRRLDSRLQHMPDVALEGAARANGLSTSTLRQLHLANNPPPAALRATLERLRLAKVSEGVEQAALEGLHMPQLANGHSERLIINAMADLPGWPSELRLELRAASPQGPVLLAAGAENAGRTCTVLKSADGYEAYLGERPVALRQDNDLCRAILQALSSVDRQALGLTASGADELRQRIHDLVVADRAMARRLLGSHLPGWGKRGRLRGGMEAPAPEAPRIEVGALFRRYRQLYPETADHQVNEQLSQWLEAGLDPARQLEDLEQQLLEFRSQMRAWAGNDPSRHAAARRLVSNWQRISEYSAEEGLDIHQISLTDLALTNEDLATLALPDRFTHIKRVDLGANPGLSHLPAEFLERFPGLQRLHLMGCGFEQLPAVAAAQTLECLDMQGNNLVWSDANQAALDRLDTLRMLDLSHNPLARSPDLNRLGELDVLNLNSCELVDWPSGIRSDEDWRPAVFDLRDNRFASLPQDLHLSRVAAQNLWLESADLSERVNQQIQAYYVRHGIDLLVADADYEEMLEDTDADDWAIWNALPLQYRRELRGLQDLPDYDQARLWRRLRTFADPRAMDYGLAIGAMRLLDAEAFPPPFEE
ncbi:dermonecrotic toxin domain-containing protein [Pseudomonas soli]|uniref:Dermonecrotic toxin N-terminal domain-containing protein n=1 Tax=Pseudomonas soli TaxID=1306993 RepID=A0A2V4IJV0_9PSED|nr:DUF6543 domain-containing protein [Pseudomonas soli]PYB83370.1 hypothetical protein DMX07_08875 [Pseudomonas soli]